MLIQRSYVKLAFASVETFCNLLYLGSACNCSVANATYTTNKL